MKHKIPPHVIYVLEKLNMAGYQAYAVGGCVRDLLIGKEPDDWDVAASSKPEETMAVFDNTVPTGIKYGTVTVVAENKTVEVTTFRSDGNYFDGRRPESVQFCRDVLLDLRRRDFTVNAMAMDINGNISDPFGGKADLDKKLIRCVGKPSERFNEDGLRMLRALRFAATLGFSVEEETMQAIKSCGYLSANLSAERSSAELGKILCSVSPEYAKTAVDCKLLSKYISECDTEKINDLNRLPYDKNMRWAAFLISAEDEDKAALARKLRLDKKTIDFIKRTEEAISAGNFEDCENAKILAAIYGRKEVITAIFLSHIEKYDKLKTFLENTEILSRDELAVSGKDIVSLGLGPGPVLGKVLDALYLHAVKDPKLNKYEILMKIAEDMINKNNSK